MDKRSILFIVCVSASYLAINAFFGLWQKESPVRLPAPPIAQTVPATPFEPEELLTANEEIPSSSSDETFYVLENKV